MELHSLLYRERQARRATRPSGVRESVRIEACDVRTPPLQPAGRGEATTARDNGPETILVIDDQETLRAIVCRMLTQRGFTVLQAASGADALEVYAAHSGQVHAVLTDVVMPNMGGPRVTEALRQADPELRVLYMSGYPAQGQVRQQATMPGTAFLQKPFTPAALEQALRALLDRRD